MSGFTQSSMYGCECLKGWHVLIGESFSVHSCSSPGIAVCTSASSLFGSWSIVVCKWRASRKLLNVNKRPEWIFFFAVKYSSPPAKQIGLLEFQPYVTFKQNTFGHAFMEFNMLRQL